MGSSIAPNALTDSWEHIFPTGFPCLAFTQGQLLSLTITQYAMFC